MYRVQGWAQQSKQEQGAMLGPGWGGFRAGWDLWKFRDWESAPSFIRCCPLGGQGARPGCGSDTSCCLALIRFGLWSRCETESRVALLWPGHGCRPLALPWHSLALLMVAFLNPRALLPTQGTAWATASVPAAGLQGPQGESHQACSQVSHQDRVPWVLCPALFLAGPWLMKQ